MPDLRVRADRPELMDTMPFEPTVVRETLGFLGMTARRFGGSSIIIDRLERWTRDIPANSVVSILDIGTGGAEIPVALARWFRSSGRRARIVALDLVPEIADIARQNASRYPEISIECRDAFHLRDTGARFDFVIASLFLHHVASPRIPDMLRLFDGLASRGVIVSDLARSDASYWAVKALSMMKGNHVVRHDGPLSVERSFTVEELTRFAAAANLGYLRAERVGWFRVALAGVKP